MTKDDIEATYVQAASLDGVQPHVVHGYKRVNSFVLTTTERMNMAVALEIDLEVLLKIVREMRKVVGKEFPILIKMNVEDFMVDRLTCEESILWGNY